MKNRWLPLVALVASFVPTLALAQNTEKGAAIGGIAGALAGAAIGKHNGETGAGALIGGAVGLVTGAAIGNSKDQEIARQQAYQQQAYAQQAYAQQQAVGMQDVVVMVQNGVSDQIIISHIQQRGVQKRPEVSEIIALHQQGVSEPVINCMQRAPVAGAYVAPAPVVLQPRPVVVEQYHYSHPYYYSRPYYHHHHHHHHGHHHHGHNHHGSGVSWGVSVHGH